MNFFYLFSTCLQQGTPDMKQTHHPVVRALQVLQLGTSPQDTKILIQMDVFAMRRTRGGIWRFQAGKFFSKLNVVIHKRSSSYQLN